MRTVSRMLSLLLIVIFGSAGPFAIELSTQIASAQTASTQRSAERNNGAERAAGKTSDVFDLAELKTPDTEMRRAIERYTVDRAILSRSYPVPTSDSRRARFKQFYTDWTRLLTKLDFDRLSHDDQVDYLLFKNHLEHELEQLEIQGRQLAEVEPLVPFAKTIGALEETRRRMEPINSAKTAAQLTELKIRVEEIRKAVEAGLPRDRRSETQSATAEGSRERSEISIRPIKAKKTVANRAVLTINSLRNTLRNWYTFYNGYDPVFTWWAQEPYRALDQSLANYSSLLAERVVGLRPEASSTTQTAPPTGGGPGGQRQAPQRTARAGDTSDIVGDPIGREALLAELKAEMIPYTPEELISIAEKEMAWCEAEMKKASQALGFGDDWHKALEHVKTLYVEPGKQPELIRELALEAIKFVTDKELVTVPELARDSWRMEMMTPERQLVSPFFLGGEVIQVSFPTNTMAHEQKMMSMRGNNIHFSRATVHHELIPGHHLQGFMTARYKPYRGLFSTPFWGEGWALYWELLLWDLNFAKSPENRIGMLFWRMHRCARIIFSLSFHLEKMTPQECIDLLVKRVGHEVDNATAEVRRSFEGSYGPLYQIAYLIGGLQLYSLHRELVDSGKMTNRAFHDWILKENRIPIEMVRAILTRQKLTRDFRTNWRFYKLGE
ncbi:MAG TPA: DUF885 family protein [Pyrinomonadaceae bacterium]|nr:DUF885 family protein [Pyrinomonadaceae bacterium]